MVHSPQHATLHPWTSLIQDTGGQAGVVAADTLGNLRWDVSLARRICADFEDDYARLSAHSFIFDGEMDAQTSTRHTVSLLSDWLTSPDTSGNLAVMAALACERFAVTDSLHQSAIMMAALLGEIENKDAFHNNMHFRKVLLQTLRMIATHNHLNHDNDNTLNAADITMLIIAACIHDLAHNGKGNFAGGEHYPGYLEQQSFNTARPYLEHVGFDDSDDLRRLNIMLLSTDVSSSTRDPLSFYEQMKAAYLHHFLMPNDGLAFSAPMAGLDNKKTSLLAAILHEADIATSAGISYEVAQMESRLLAMETGISIIGTPQGLTTFLEKVCHDGMIVEAGDYLYETNMQDIIKAALHDVEHKNNAPFPSIKQAALLKL